MRTLQPIFFQNVSLKLSIRLGEGSTAKETWELCSERVRQLRFVVWGQKAAPNGGHRLSPQTFTNIFKCMVAYVTTKT